MIIKILIIAILSYMGSIGAPFFFGTTGGFYTLGRPLIAAALVGIILGDVQTALAIGVVLQAMYIGVITPGGVMPFDVDYVGYLTTALIILAKANTSLAPALAIPVGLVGVLLWNITYVSNVAFIRYADKKVEEGSTKGVRTANLLPQIWCFIVRVVPAVVILYFGSEFLQNFVNNLPPQVNQMLGVISGLLPALGIGILLNMIIKEKVYLGIYLIGFILVVYLKLPIIAVTLMGIVIALFYYKFVSSKSEESFDPMEKETQAEKGIKMPESILKKVWFNWFMFNGPSQSGERMQGIAFGHSMTPVIEKLYRNNKEERIKALRRHTTLFNVEPQIGAIIPGIVTAMEEQRANGAEIEEDTINTVKVALMGPLSGIGDTLVPGTLIPILLAIAIGITNSAGLAGPLFYAVVYIGGTILYSWYLFKLGYKSGLSGLQKIMAEGSISALTTALNIVGLLVMGALTANYIHVTTPLQYVSGKMVVSIQGILDGIFPGMLSLGAVALVYLLLSKKKLSATKIILILFAIAIVGVLIGIL